MSFSRDEIKQELIRRGAIPSSNFDKSEIEDELNRRGVSIPKKDTVNTFIGELKKPTKDMFNPNEEQINQMALMAMPEGRILSPLLKNARSISFLDKLNSLIIKNHPIVKSMLKTIGTGTEGATIGASANPNDKTEGALLGFGLGGGGRAISEAISPLKPSNLFRGNATPEEMRRNMEAARGTSSNLGNIVQNPLIKEGFENLAAKLPFSGAHQKLAEVGQQVTNKAQDILNQYLPENVSPLQVSDKLGEALIKAKRQATKTKENAYTNANQRAEKENLKLQLPSFSKLSSQYVDSIENTSMLQYEPEVKSLINRLKGYTQPVKTTVLEGKLVDKQGNPLLTETNTQYPSLKEANILAGRLNDLSKKFSTSLNSMDRGASTILGSLGKALKNDIKKSIDNHGSTELKSDFEKAEENYKDNYHPFLDKDLLQFTENNRAPEELIASFLQNSRTSDKGAKLSKLMDKLNPKDQNLVRYGYFSRALQGAEDAQSVNPNKLKTLWTQLGSNQKRVLVPNKEERKIFDNFVNLTSSNQAALRLMDNPKTGHQLNVKYLLKAPFGIAARPLVNKLSSEDFRERLVNKMMENVKNSNQENR